MDDVNYLSLVSSDIAQEIDWRWSKVIKMLITHASTESESAVVIIIKRCKQIIIKKSFNFF